MIVTAPSGESTVFPYQKVFTWIFLIGLRSQFGLGLLRDRLRQPLLDSSYRRLKAAAFEHVMSLSMDFYDGEDSHGLMSTINKSGCVGKFLVLLTELLVPQAVDVVVAYVYIYFLLGIYGVSTIVVVSII